MTTWGYTNWSYCRRFEFLYDFKTNRNGKHMSSFELRYLSLMGLVNGLLSSLINERTLSTTDYDKSIGWDYGRRQMKNIIIFFSMIATVDLPTTDTIFFGKYKRTLLKVTFRRHIDSWGRKKMKTSFFSILRLDRLDWTWKKESTYVKNTHISLVDWITLCSKKNAIEYFKSGAIIMLGFFVGTIEKHDSNDRITARRRSFLKDTFPTC